MTSDAAIDHTWFAPMDDLLDQVQMLIQQAGGTVWKEIEDEFEFIPFFSFSK